MTDDGGCVGRHSEASHDGVSDNRIHERQGTVSEACLPQRLLYFLLFLFPAIAAAGQARVSVGKEGGVPYKVSPRQQLYWRYMKRPLGLLGFLFPAMDEHPVGNPAGPRFPNPSFGSSSRALLP